MARTLESEPEYALASQQQLTDATELLEHPTCDAFGTDAHDRHLVGAMYLAGYAVECALKGFLLRKFGHLVTPAPGISITFDAITSHVAAAAGKSLRDLDLHSLSDLWNATGLATRDVAMTANQGTCTIWRVEWRYRPPAGTLRREAQEFVQAAEELAIWTDGQTP